jgi:Acetyltransferase (GNAT) domain
MQNPLLDRSPYELPGEAHRHKHVYAFDLTRPVDELFARLHTNRRRQLRRWDQVAAGLVVDRDALTAFLLEHYRAFFLARNATAVYDLAPASLAFLAHLDNVVLVGAADGGRVTAVSMFGYTPAGADYLFNVSTPEGRRHSAALIWYAVLRLRGLGVPWLNLGGGVSEDDGVARFKQRFGADVLPLTYLKQVYDRPRYAELCRWAGVDPDDLSGWFPPYRRP